MALAYLKIFLSILVLLGIVLEILMYKKENSKTVYLINILFVFVLSYVNFTSQPTNYLRLRLLSISWSLMALIGLMLMLKNGRKRNITRYLISIATIGGIVQLLIM